jgi:hypothetical protein
MESSQNRVTQIGTSKMGRSKMSASKLEITHNMLPSKNRPVLGQRKAEPGGCFAYTYWAILRLNSSKASSVSFV